MLKNIFYASASILMLALSYNLGARNAGAQATPQVVRAVSSGRWTIVNGTPQYARNIMLLDTATGESWITCNDSEGATAWCHLPKYMTGTSRDSTR